MIFYHHIVQPTVPHTHTHTLPYERDAEAQHSVHLVELRGGVGSDEHLKAERHLDLSQRRGDEQGLAAQQHRHTGVVVGIQRTCTTQL